MTAITARWTLQPQECEGTYSFSGQSLMTRKIAEELAPMDIIYIHSTIKKLVLEKGGLDYLQVFINNDTGKKIFVIDQLNEEMKKENSSEFVKNNDYFTILFAEEY